MSTMPSDSAPPVSATVAVIVVVAPSTTAEGDAAAVRVNAGASLPPLLELELLPLLELELLPLLELEPPPLLEPEPLLDPPLIPLEELVAPLLDPAPLPLSGN